MSNVVQLVQPQAQPTFDDFWKAYPRRVAKLDAMKAWQKAIRLSPPEQIIAAAVAYAKKAEMPYIAYPATWLRAGRWMDEEVGSSEPMVTSEEDRLRQLSLRWFTEPMTAFKRQWIRDRIPQADKDKMVELGLITTEEARQ